MFFSGQAVEPGVHHPTMVSRRSLFFDATVQAGHDDWESPWLLIVSDLRIMHHIRLEITVDMFMNLALKPAGSRFLQEFIETVSCTRVMMELQQICLEHALLLTKHYHANFVVTKIIQESSPWFCSALSAALTGHVCSLARHQRGSRVLERIMEHHSNGKIDFFFAELVAHSPRIVGNKYGNYVIQHVVEFGPQHWSRLCLVLVLKYARRSRAAGCYMRCTLSYVYKRSNDEYILRLLMPLRSLFHKAELNIDNMSVGQR